VGHEGAEGPLADVVGFYNGNLRGIVRIDDLKLNR
jgi:hypothetical protein